MIQITDLSFSFGKTRVLENLNLTVPDGCIMGLVGINGAGKSTLFRLLTSIYTAESGSISYDGIPPQDEHLRKKVCSSTRRRAECGRPNVHRTTLFAPLLLRRRG